jgi:hypothetical protein
MLNSLLPSPIASTFRNSEVGLSSTGRTCNKGRALKRNQRTRANLEPWVRLAAPYVKYSSPVCKYTEFHERDSVAEIGTNATRTEELWKLGHTTLLATGSSSDGSRVEYAGVWW